MQFKDLKAQYLALKPEIDQAIQSVLDSSAFILGKPVAELEERLAAHTNRRHCVTCASGSDALLLALMALDIGPGDAVFVPDFTYVATAGAASLLGAAVILVDIDPKTFNLSPEALDAAIQRVLREGRFAPRAVIPVDLFGLPADYPRLLSLAEKYGLTVIEDGAQGFGGSIRQKPACSFGELSITSFFPAKPLGCYGDGGAIFVDDEALAERLRSLRTHGRSRLDKYDSLETGINSRLDTLQAAVLLPKLRAFISTELDAVNAVARQYSQRLDGVVVTPHVPDGYRSCWAQYTIALKDQAQRDRVRAALTERQVPTMIYYPKGLHQQKAYQQAADWSDGLFPHTTAAAQTVLSLPIHPYMREEDVAMTANIILESLSREEANP